MHCIKKCISKKYLPSRDLLEKALSIITDIGYFKQTGRRPHDPELVIQAIYYLVKTGIQWNGLPKCFGSSSTIHAAFQRLLDLGFFENFMLAGLEEYHQKIGLDLKRKVGDCAHIKSPIGKDHVGPSPVDRRKNGTKRSMITDGNGILLSCVLAGGNRNDAKLLKKTMQDIPDQFQSDGSHQLWLDAIYDTKEVRQTCFAYKHIPRISPNPRSKKVEPVRPITDKVRWVVERSHSWINRFRRLFTRYDKSGENYVAFIKFAATSLVFAKLGVSG
jgi:putative transposase